MQYYTCFTTIPAKVSQYDGKPVSHFFSTSWQYVTIIPNDMINYINAAWTQIRGVRLI